MMKIAIGITGKHDGDGDDHHGGLSMIADYGGAHAFYHVDDDGNDGDDHGDDQDDAVDADGKMKLARAFMNVFVSKHCDMLINILSMWVIILMMLVPFVDNSKVAYHSIFSNGPFDHLLYHGGIRSGSFCRTKLGQTAGKTDPFCLRTHVISCKNLPSFVRCNKEHLRDIFETLNFNHQQHLALQF